ncbi:MAG: hypothetical protein R2789_14070 [Microthrixaceae bacterium]
MAAPAVPIRASITSTVGAYVALTKPRIIELLLITTVPVMIVADQGVPSLWLIAATVIGGTLSAGGAARSTCGGSRHRRRHGTHSRTGRS